MKPIIDETLSEIVTAIPASAAVFEKYDLDYCCHGKRTLAKACEGDKEKLTNVERELKEISCTSFFDEEQDFDTMEVSKLCDYIVGKHHRYIKETSPVIFAHLEKVSSKHGDRHPELRAIFQLFTEVKNEMTSHMQKEEIVLFPRIKMLSDSSEAASGGVQNIAAPVNMMEMEHEHAGNLLHEIRKITADYTPPADACTTYRLSFNELKEFEQDLHQHVHLENNILFPRALEMFGVAAS